MNQQTKSLLSRGVSALAWVESRLLEVEGSQGSSPDLLRMQRDCKSLLGRLAGELQAVEDPEVQWHPGWLGLISGQDLAFLQSRRGYLARDSKGGGGYLRAILELEGFISQFEWV